MATCCSTGFRAAILGATAFETLFSGGCIEVFSGSQPATADLAATGTRLARITAGGGAWVAGAATNGLQFTRSSIYALNDPAQSWILTGLATGTAGYARLIDVAGVAGDSSTARRIDMAVGLNDPDVVGDYQLRLPSLAITASTLIPVSSWWFYLPSP